MYETTVGFGGRLKLAIEASGGLAGASRRIEDALGFLAPSRGTYRALYEIESVENLSDEQTFRAFLLLVAVGLDPEAWLVTPVRVPEVLDLERLSGLVRRQGLEPRTRWLRGSGDTLCRSRDLFNERTLHK